MSDDLLAAIMAGAATAARQRARLHAARVDRAAAERTPRGGLFREQLSAPGFRVIAECKRRSPSKGVLRVNYDAAAIAAGYARAGAAAISVLTETAFFDGDLAHLSAVREVVDVPVLRKDFISETYQLTEARAAGADAILLIVAGLDDATLTHLLRRAEGEDLGVLVEVHNAEERARAIGAGATVIGVNSRNLKTLDVDTSVHESLVSGMPAGVVAVAESGLRTGADLVRLRAAGYSSFLIGERFMTASDPGAALASLLKECA